MTAGGIVEAAPHFATTEEHPQGAIAQSHGPECVSCVRCFAKPIRCTPIATARPAVFGFRGVHEQVRGPFKRTYGEGHAADDEEVVWSVDMSDGSLRCLTLKRGIDLAQDHSELGATLNGFSLNETGQLSTAIEKTGQAVDTTSMSTTKRVSGFFSF